MTAVHKKTFEDLAVLVADADSVTQDLAVGYLKDQGALVTVADDCGSIMSRLQETSQTDDAIKIAFIDINLPGGNVPDVLKEIRADDVLKEIPIIILTKDAARENVHECFLYGINGFVLKPTQKSMLEEELRKVVRRISNKFV